MLMKVLHIGKYYPPIVGGMESITKFVVDALPHARHTVVSFNRTNKSVAEHHGNTVVIRDAISGVVANQPISFRYLKDICRVLTNDKPDVVHIHFPNPWSAFCLLLNKKRYKLIVHWHFDVFAQKYLSKIVKPIETLVLKRADAIIVTSPGYMDFSKNLKPFKNKLSLIPCSINEDSFSIKGDNDKIHKIKQHYQGKKIVLFIGRHVKYKGLRYLLEAEKLVKGDCVFLIGGTGPLTKSLKEEFTSDRILWLGMLSDNELRHYYHAADIFAFPSITPNEAFGVALAEAMYCECPAVTFTIPHSGVNWVSVNNLTGLQVDNIDIRQYAAAIDRLLIDEELRVRLGHNAKERVMGLFSKNIISKKYSDLYDSMLQKSHPDNEQP